MVIYPLLIAGIKLKRNLILLPHTIEDVSIYSQLFIRNRLFSLEGELLVDVEVLVGKTIFRMFNKDVLFQL